jgi:PIN domain nuclease of toxin-antitoxin system
VKLLLDTHLLLWAASNSKHLSRPAKTLLNDNANTLYFSVVSLWEIVIKRGMGRTDFQVEPRSLRRNLIDNGYTELTIVSEHTFAVLDLPTIHKDPFDRMLIAQAMVEGLTLLTSDLRVSSYPGPVRAV